MNVFLRYKGIEWGFNIVIKLINLKEYRMEVKGDIFIGRINCFFLS